MPSATAKKYMYHIEIKKRANSRKYTPIQNFATESEVIEYVKRNSLHIENIPYMFTHILLNNGSIITQNDDRFGLMCSPQKLAGMLQAQNL